MRDAIFIFVCTTSAGRRYGRMGACLCASTGGGSGRRSLACILQTCRRQSSRVSSSRSSASTPSHFACFPSSSFPSIAASTSTMPTTALAWTAARIVHTIVGMVIILTAPFFSFLIPSPISIPSLFPLPLLFLVSFAFGGRFCCSLLTSLFPFFTADSLRRRSTLLALAAWVTALR